MQGLPCTTFQMEQMHTARQSISFLRDLLWVIDWHESKWSCELQLQLGPRESFEATRGGEVLSPAAKVDSRFLSLSANRMFTLRNGYEIEAKIGVVDALFQKSRSGGAQSNGTFILLGNQANGLSWVAQAVQSSILSRFRVHQLLSFPNRFSYHKHIWIEIPLLTSKPMLVNCTLTETSRLAKYTDRFHANIVSQCSAE